MEFVSDTFEHLLNFWGSRGFIDILLGIDNSKAEEFHVQLVKDGVEGFSNGLLFECWNFDKANASVDAEFTLEILNVKFSLDWFNYSFFVSFLFNIK